MSLAPPAKTETPSSMCPGQKNLMSGRYPQYLRASFGVYWMGAGTGFDFLYYEDKQLFGLNAEEIARINAQALALLKANSTGEPIEANFLGFCGYEMREGEVESLGWHVITADD